MVKIELNNDEKKYYINDLIINECDINYDSELLYNFYRHSRKNNSYIRSTTIWIKKDCFIINYYQDNSANRITNYGQSLYFEPKEIEYIFYYNLILKTKNNLYYCKDENEINILKRTIKIQKINDKI